MSYPSLSGYYNSSAQSSGGASNNQNGYSSSSRNGNSSMYGGSMNNMTNTTQPSAYESSYGWSNQSAYPSTAPTEQSNDTYQSSSGYGYERNTAYGTQANSAINDPYSQDYYPRSSVAQSRQPVHNQNDGLSSLAYASGLDSANSRSSSTRNTQSYEIPPIQQQTRVRSPVEPSTRYSVNPPAVASSYSMRQQNSSSSVSSNQMAIDAAAALAGAVGRRNANNIQSQNLRTSRESPGLSNARLGVSSASRQTASPQLNTASRSNQSHSSTPAHVQPQSQQQSQQQQRSQPTQYHATSSQSASRQAPTYSASTDQSQSNTPSQTSSRRPNTRSSPRNVRQTGSIASLVTAAHETESAERSQSPQVQESAQTFIDPTSIFDPYAQERERRRQAAERAAIEAKKQAEEDARRQAEEEVQRKVAEAKAAAEAAERKKVQEAEARKNKATAKITQPNSASKRNSKATAATPTPQSEEERMAAELKAMMEKMKAFQSKDPSLFKRLWDDMRPKPGPSVTAAAVDTPSPQPAHPSQLAQPAQQSLPTTQILSQNALEPTTPADKSAASRTRPRRRDKRQALGEDGQPLHANGYDVVVENNPEGLPDLGRFPAERRIRSKYHKRSKTGEESADIMGQEDDSSPAPGAVQTPQDLAAQPAMTTPAAKPSSGTIWPLEKRNALTSTALRALKAIPENENVSLTEDDLRKMLESNPSYIDLCQQLEAKGLTFHRGNFARELLNSVPDLKGGTPTSHPVPASVTPSRQPAILSATPTGASVPPPPPSLSQSQPPPQPAYSSPYQAPPPPPARYAPPYSHPPPQYGPPPGQFLTQGPPQYGYGVLYPPGQVPPPPARAPLSKPYGFSTRPEPPPGSKEAAARKRDFSELIDLTDLGDDDNYVTPDKVPRLEGPDSGDESSDPFLAYRKQNQAMNSSRDRASGYFPPPPLAQNPGNQIVPPWPTARSGGPIDQQGNKLYLAKPIDKEEALKKQYYDPKTVARDILIATGRHPSERPLNVHYAGMLGSFIELDSNIDTFEWDEVDPGGPPVPKVPISDVPASKPRYQLGERVLKKPRKHKSLVQAVVDKTRAPDKEKRASGATSPQAAPETPDQNTVTSKSPSLKDQLKKASFKKPASKLRHSLLASDEQATPAQFDPTHLPQVQSDRTTSAKPVQTSNPAMSQEPVRRRGRPPGAKNKYPSVGGLKAQAGEMKVKINVPLRESTPVTKEKYKCKWKKCSTVLHNLDTLRKHIGRVHRPSSADLGEGYTCWWKKCRFLKQDEETGDWITTKVFDHWEDWLKHIEKEHVTPIAARWGDGPATSHVDPTTIAQDRKIYLSDHSGLETTPRLDLTNNHNYPSDTLNLTELDHRLLGSSSMTEKQKIEEAAYVAFMRAHGINVKKHEESREASREVLRSLKRRKEMVGAGVDRGGCTLVDEVFRVGFVQSPGVRRVVSAK